jgi:hypothetical protein
LWWLRFLCGLRVELVLQQAQLPVEIGDQLTQSHYVTARRQIERVPQLRGAALDETLRRLADADRDAEELRELLAPCRAGYRRCDPALDATDDFAQSRRLNHRSSPSPAGSFGSRARTVLYGRA